MQFKFSAYLLMCFFIVVPPAWSYPKKEIRSVETSREKKIRKLRDAEFKQIRIALGRRLPKNRRAELYFRLAESYLEGYRTTFLLEGRVHEKRINRGGRNKKINRKNSREFLKKGIKACKALIDLKISYSKMDHVYYFLAFNYEELGSKKNSKKYYAELLKKHPKSPFAVEAYREMANTAYHGNRFKDAIKNYKKALKKENQVRKLGVLPELLYRLSWSYYRTRKYNRAVQVMKRAIRESKAENEKYLSVYEEALQGLAIFMTETGKVEEAIQYFKGVSGGVDRYAQILYKLGQQYERNLKIKKAILVYKAILESSADREFRFEVSVKLIELEIRRSRHTKAVKRLSTTKIFKSGTEKTVANYKKLKSMIRRIATKNHSEFRKRKKRQYLLNAKKYYEAYLAFILKDKGKEAIEIKMYLADVNQSLGNSKKSAEIYKEILSSGDSRYSKEAGALWVQSLWEAIQKSSKIKKIKTNNPGILEQKFIEASERLQKVIPESREAKESELKAAQILAGYQKTKDEALKRAGKIIENRPSSLHALVAGRLMIQILEDDLPNPKKSNAEIYLERAEKFQDVVLKLEKNKTLLAFDQKKGKSKIAIRLSQVKNDLRIGSIMIYENDKNFEKAAAAYENFAIESKTQKIAENAYLNALDAYIKNKDFSEAERLVLAWENRFPKSKKAIRSVRSVATQFLVLGQFEQSSNLFKYLGLKGNDSKALITAIRLREASGKIEKMLELYFEYRKRYKKHRDRWGLFLKIGKYYDAEKENQLAIESFRSCQTGPILIGTECGARLGDVLFRMGDLDGAKKVYDRVAFRLGRKSMASPFVAYSRHRLAVIMEKEVQFVALRLPEKQLQKGLSQRLKFFEKLSRVYRKAAEAGGPWGIASLGRLARWTLNFADDVDQIAPPSDSSPVEAGKFKKTLRTVSQPLRKKAVQSLRKAYRNALTGRVLVPTIVGMTHDLSEFRDSIIAPAQGSHDLYRLSKNIRYSEIKKVRSQLISNPKDSNAWVEYGNLLLEDKGPKLAKIAYQRAIILSSKNVLAYNNLAVLLLNEDVTNWLKAYKAKNLLKKAINMKGELGEVRWNLAQLYSYYRLFRYSLPLWERILRTRSEKASYQGVAMARIALSKIQAFESAHTASRNLKGRGSEFSDYYSEAVRHWLTGKKDSMEKCLDSLSEISKGDLIGFERSAYERLRRTCRQWKSKLNL